MPQVVNNHTPTKQARMLYEALREKGVNAQLEYSDGHKTVDIAILDAHIYIEVDGIQHFTDPEHIMKDFKRSHFSDGDDFNTFHVTNQIIDRYLNEVVDALVKVVEMIAKKQVTSII
jgi:very-short-patch-repair endonuclease